MNARSLTWFIYPSLIAGVFALTGALLSLGLPEVAVSSSVLLGVIATTLLLERITPLHATWNRRPDGLDLLLLVVNRAVDLALIGGLLAILGALESSGVSLAWVRIWPTSAPLWSQAVLGIVLADGIRYVLHRVSHHHGLLWRWHRVHHQPERMYALNGPRLHPANHVWVAAAHVVPMLVLGADLHAVVMAATVTAFFVIFQHSNVSLPFTGLNRVFATPDVHRLHHARELGAGRGVNFGIVVLFFDQLCGTYRPVEEETAPDAIGLVERA